MRVLLTMMANPVVLDLLAVAAIIPAALVGAVVGFLALGPPGFLAGGVLAGSSGALLARRLDMRPAPSERSS
jgi:hypothetical protein